MKTNGLFLLILATPASACIVGPSPGQLGIFLIALTGFALFFVGGQLDSTSKSPTVADWCGIGAMWISAPFALLAGAGVLGLTSHSAQWQCTFSESASGQILFHIALPLTIAVFGTAFFNRTRDLSFREFTFWPIAGMWATTFMVQTAVIAYDWNGSGTGNIALRALHYGAIFSFCTVPIVTAKWRPKSFGDRWRAVGKLLLLYMISGILVGAALRVTN